MCYLQHQSWCAHDGKMHNFYVVTTSFIKVVCLLYRSKSKHAVVKKEWPSARMALLKKSKIKMDSQGF